MPTANIIRIQANSNSRILPICRYEAGSSSLIVGCTCSKATGGCNDFLSLKKHVVKHLDRPLTEEGRKKIADKKSFCYSLRRFSTTPLNESEFDKLVTLIGRS